MSEYNPNIRNKRKRVPHKKINCMKCKFFFITWEKQNPYACKIFGFKGRMMPSVQVRLTTGVECPSFELKNRG